MHGFKYYTLIRSILSNRTVTRIISDCYIREYYKPGLFELDPGTHMTRRKSDPFDPDIRIDPTRLQRWYVTLSLPWYIANSTGMLNIISQLYHMNNVPCIRRPFARNRRPCSWCVRTMHGIPSQAFTVPGSGRLGP